MSRNYNTSNSGRQLTLCSSKFPSYLNQILFALQMLQLNPYHRKGVALKDIERFMRKRFNANGDVQSQVKTALLEAIREGFVFQPSVKKYFNLGAIAGVQLSAANSKRRCAEISNASNIFVSSPITTKCEQKHLRIPKCSNTKPMMPSIPKMDVCSQKNTAPCDEGSTTKLINKFTDFIKNTSIKLPCKQKTRKCIKVKQEKCPIKRRKRRGVLSRTISKIGRKVKRSIRSCSTPRKRSRSSQCDLKKKYKRKCYECDHYIQSQHSDVEEQYCKNPKDTSKGDHIYKDKHSKNKDKKVKRVSIKESTSTIRSNKIKKNGEPKNRYSSLDKSEKIKQRKSPSQRVKTSKPITKSHSAYRNSENTKISHKRHMNQGDVPVEPNTYCASSNSSKRKNSFKTSDTLSSVSSYPSSCVSSANTPRSSYSLNRYSSVS